MLLHFVPTDGNLHLSLVKKKKKNVFHVSLQGIVSSHFVSAFFFLYFIVSF